MARMRADASPTTQFLLAYLPPDVAEAIYTNLVHPHAPFQVYKRRFLVEAHRARHVVAPYVQPLADRLLALVTENQGVVGLLALALAIAVVVSILSLVHRVMMWCTRFALRVVFWAGVLAVAAWAWQRGPMETLRDLIVTGSKVAGFAAGVANHWLQEYDRYDGQQRQAGAAARGRSNR